MALAFSRVLASELTQSCFFSSVSCSSGCTSLGSVYLRLPSLTLATSPVSMYEAYAHVTQLSVE